MTSSGSSPPLPSSSLPRSSAGVFQRRLPCRARARISCPCKVSRPRRDCASGIRSGCSRVRLSSTPRWLCNVTPRCGSRGGRSRSARRGRFHRRAVTLMFPSPIDLLRKSARPGREPVVVRLRDQVEAQPEPPAPVAMALRNPLFPVRLLLLRCSFGALRSAYFRSAIESPSLGTVARERRIVGTPSISRIAASRRHGGTAPP